MNVRRKQVNALDLFSCFCLIYVLIILFHGSFKLNVFESTFFIVIIEGLIFIFWMLTLLNSNNNYRETRFVMSFWYAYFMFLHYCLFIKPLPFSIFGNNEFRFPIYHFAPIWFLMPYVKAQEKNGKFLLKFFQFLVHGLYLLIYMGLGFVYLFQLFRISKVLCLLFVPIFFYGAKSIPIVINKGVMLNKK